MLFNSAIFIFAFLPICLFVYLLTPSLRGRNTVIIIFSSIFFIWGDIVFFLMVVAGTLFDYFLIKYAMNNPIVNSKIKRRNILAITVFINVMLLVFFKYGNFLIDQVNPLLVMFDVSKPDWYGIALPLGISFITFHRISLIVDCYRDPSVTPRSFADTLLYIIVFPHMIAGPIVQYAEICRFFYSRAQQYRRFIIGALIFSIGLSKKVLLADPLGSIADFGFNEAYTQLPSSILWMTVLAYTLQIYFDFSGYSDMALGLARMFGFRFPRNFNHPYTATSITDFWRRWHITLSKWMGRYLYVPLGGNRVSSSRNFINLWIVFMVSGFWHGAAWNFLLWGCFHGLFISLDKVFIKFNIMNRVHWSIKQGLTFFIVLNSWVLFRANDISQVVYFYKRMYFEFEHSYQQLFWLDYTPYQITILLIASMLAIFPFRRHQIIHNMGRRLFRNTTFSLYLTCGMILVCSAFIFANSTETFLYFRF